MQNNIKKIREEKKITQEALASSVGISRRTLSSIEHNKTKPSIDVALQLSNKLNVSVDKLFIMSSLSSQPLPHTIKYIDLFCGIGGFRYAADQSFKNLGIKGKCVFSSDIDIPAQKSYSANFNEIPAGDITKIDADSIPSFDLLFAGFPCQAFSIIGKQMGFEDKTRGTLFFDIARILKAKKPKAFVLENVKQLVSHKQGKTIETIITTLRDELNYFVEYKILNALDYGLPQKRERVIIVGAQKPFIMNWPDKLPNRKTLADILETNIDPKHYASEQIVSKRKSMHQSKYKPAIWHENKAGNISSYPYSCALRAGASYNYLLVDGERRLTPREMLRLQGFPDSFKIVVSDAQIRKQAGNAVPVNLVKCVLDNFIPLVFS